MDSLNDVITAWQNNLTFREAFKKDPKVALKTFGFELAEADLKKVRGMLGDSDGSLENRINK